MLKTITTETCIPRGAHETVYSAQRIYIRIRDNVSSPYLAIEGVNEEPDEDGSESGHEFYLDSEKEIDEFATICKRILREAIEINKGV